jgi:uncharacterized membrane protein
MLVNNSVIAIYGNHTAAEEAVKELHKSGFDMKKTSIVGKDYQSEEQVIGYYNTGERVGYWGKSGAFWGAIWGFLFGSALIFIPGVGPILVAGPLVAALIGALEGAVITGGLSALGAALYSIGIPENSIIQYETSLKSDKFLLIVHGTIEEVKRAYEILETTKVEDTASYMAPISLAV